MAIRVAINGFGRIGRLVARLCLSDPRYQLVAINDVGPVDNLAYLFKHDSVHRTFPLSVHAEERFLVVGGTKIPFSSYCDFAQLSWGEHEVDVLVEATGLFLTRLECQKHLDRGAKRVLITAPPKDQTATFVYGVNHQQYDPHKDLIFSNASCTTNCLAIIAKVLLDAFGIEEGLMTTVHAITASDHVVDTTSKRDWRAGRTVLNNIIPASTGAAKTVARCLPSLEGKLTGMAFRVPVSDVSVVDLTVRLATSTTYGAICEAMQSAAAGELSGLLQFSDEKVVSSDFIGSLYSAIFDKEAGIALNDRFFKLIAWYDNEMGYAQRVLDLLAYAHQQSLQRQ